MDRIGSETIFGISMLRGCGSDKNSQPTVVQEFSSTDFGGKIEARCKVPLFPGGCAVVILVPWKPVALVPGFLSASRLVLSRTA